MSSDRTAHPTTTCAVRGAHPTSASRLKLWVKPKFVVIAKAIDIYKSRFAITTKQARWKFTHHFSCVELLLQLLQLLLARRAPYNYNQQFPKKLP